MAFFRLYSANEPVVVRERMPYAIPMTSLKTHDAMVTNLPGTAANDDMGLVTGTPGTNALKLQGVDFGGTTCDEKAAFEFVLPAEYAPGGNITLRAYAGMTTAISDGTCTLDCECWADDGDGTVSSDLCLTSAQSINSLTFAYKEFSINPAGRQPGDRLFVRLAFAGSDTGNAAVMIPTITSLHILLDITG